MGKRVSNWGTCWRWVRKKTRTKWIKTNNHLKSGACCCEFASFWRVTWGGVFQTDSAYIYLSVWMYGEDVWLNFRNLFTSQSGKPFPCKLMCALLHLNHWETLSPDMYSKWIKWNISGERVHYFSVSFVRRWSILCSVWENWNIVSETTVRLPHLQSGIPSEWTPVKDVTGN